MTGPRQGGAKGVGRMPQPQVEQDSPSSVYLLYFTTSKVRCIYKGKAENSGVHVRAQVPVRAGCCDDGMPVCRGCQLCGEFGMPVLVLPEYAQRFEF